MRRLGSRTQLLLDAVVIGYFLPIGMMFVGVSRFTREHLHGGDMAVGLATTIFFLSAIVARPLAGRWMDRIGRRPFVLPPLVGMALTTLAIGAAGQIWIVVAIRFLQGAIGASLYTALAATATDLAPPERRGAAMARLSVMVYFGFAVGPLIGEHLFDHHQWTLFVTAAAITGLAALLAFALPETKPPQIGGPQADVPVKELLLAVRRPGLAQFTVGFGYACLIAFLTKYSREMGLGGSGWLFLTFAVCTLTVRAVSGPLGDRIGYAKVALPGVAAIGVGLGLLAVAWHGWVAFPAIALVGIGFGGSFPALTAVAALSAPDSARGAALGTFFSYNDLGNAIAGPAVGAIAEAAGFRWVYGTPAIVMVLGVAVVVGMLPTRSAAGSSA